MTTIEWVAWGVAVVAYIWGYVSRGMGIKRENPEALAERERQLRQAHENGRRGLPFIPQPKSERRGK